MSNGGISVNNESGGMPVEAGMASLAPSLHSLERIDQHSVFRPKFEPSAS
jgi:hypothetical protein